MTQEILTPNEVRAKLGLKPAAELRHISVSSKPWSNFKEGDYSISQWHNACLIHHHNGPATMKTQCKLPVREPDGTLNRNALAAAAGALAGARSGLIASSADKASAAKQLLSLYTQIGETPPPSLKHDAMVEKTDDFLAHFGIKGMKWGVRRARGPEGTVSSLPGVHGGGSHGGTEHTPTDFEKAQAVKLKAKKEGLSSLSNTEMQTLVNRMNLERQYAQLTATPSRTERGRAFVKEQLKTGKTVNEMIAFANSPAGHLIASALRGSGRKHVQGVHAKPGNLRGLVDSLKTSKKKGRGSGGSPFGSAAVDVATTSVGL